MLDEDTVPRPLARDTPLDHLALCCPHSGVLCAIVGETRLWASRPGRAGILAASFKLFSNEVKEFSGPVWPFSDEKPRPR